jgi:hypothetical protein
MRVAAKRRRRRRRRKRRRTRKRDVVNEVGGKSQNKQKAKARPPSKAENSVFPQPHFLHIRDLPHHLITSTYFLPVLLSESGPLTACL